VDIDAMEREQDQDYTARRDAGKVAEALKSRVAAMAVPAADLPAQAIDVDALTLKLQNASNHNSVVAAQRQEKERKFESAQACGHRADEIGLEIDRLKAKILELEGQINQQFDQRDKLLAEADAVVIGQPIDTAEVAAELTKANQTNAEIQRAANYRQLVKDQEAADEAWEAIDKRMKLRETERDAAIARAKMPIENLSIKNGEVVYDGFPLNQASNAAQIRVSMAIGMAANPKLRVLCVRDGSLMDADSLGLVDELAKANKFQVLIERVETDGNVSVVMEDGSASGEDVVEEK
jgi:hypothetical protein